MNRASSRRIFFMNLLPKMAVKMNFGVITKNHPADPEIGFPTKSILKPYSRATAMPTVWELRFFTF